MSKSILMFNIKQLLKSTRAIKNQRLSRTFALGRRDFLKSATTVAVGALPAVSFLTSCAESLDPLDLSKQQVRRKPGEKSDAIVIIGAGIAGLSAAFHLKRRGVDCEIYEANSRVGGRMFTQPRFNSDGMTCELGGELVDSSHEEIMNLCKFFGIAVDDFRAKDQGLEQNLFYFRESPAGARKLFTDNDALKMLLDFDQRFEKDSMRLETAEGFARFDSMSLQDYLDSYRNQVDHWFLEMLRVAFVGECGVEASEMSAIPLLGMLDSSTEDGFNLFGSSDQAKRIRGGNQALTTALENWLIRNGVTMHLDSPLVAMMEKTNHIELIFESSGKQTTVKARRAVCTIPFTVLRAVDGVFQINLSKEKKLCIRGLNYGTNAKLMVGFQDRSWRKPTNHRGIFRPASNGMAYSDLFIQNIWETSRLQPSPLHQGNSGILTVFLGGNSGANLAPGDLQRCLSEIGEIFPSTLARFDGNSAAFNWSQHRWSRGSYSCSRPGDGMRFAGGREPSELSGKLLFAGEHVAPGFTGFMNGACLSGKSVAALLLSEKAA